MQDLDVKKKKKSLLPKGTGEVKPNHLSRVPGTELDIAIKTIMVKVANVY